MFEAQLPLTSDAAVNANYFYKSDPRLSNQKPSIKRALGGHL